MTGRTFVFALVCMALAGCGSTRTLDGDPAGWSSTLGAGDRLTVHENAGRQAAIRYETIDDGVLHGTRRDDAGSGYSIPLADIEQLEIEESGGGNGKTIALVGLVVLGVALIDALQKLPPGFPAYE